MCAGRLLSCPEAKQIEHAECHDEDGSCLSHEIGGKAHEQGEEGAAEESHNHQSAHFVLLLGHGLEGSGEAEGEDVGVAVADEGDGGVEHGASGAEEHAEHGEGHEQDGDEQEGAAGDSLEDETAREAADGAEDEVEGGGEGGFVEGHAEAFDEEFGGSGVGAHVDAHVTYDAEEAEQDEGIAEQFESTGECLAHRLAFVFRWFFVDGSGEEQQGGDDADDEIDGEEDSPAEPEGGDGGCGSPHGDVGCHEGGDGLDELSEGEGGSEVAALHHGGHEGVERCLHEGVADAEQGEGDEHDGEVLAEDGDEEGHGGDEEGEEHGVLASDSVHQQAGGHAEQEEPEEYEGGKEVGHGVAEREVFFHIVGGDAHEVNKAHREKAEHDGHDFGEVGLHVVYEFLSF